MTDNAWISILGLFKNYDHIFDGLTLPKASELDLGASYMLDNVEDLSRETLIYKILMDLAELPLVYTDPELIQFMIQRWSAARTPVWRELWKTTLYKYVPIWNKEGTYLETRNLATTGSSAGTQQDTTGSTGEREQTSTHEVTGYDTDSYAADTRDKLEEEMSTTGNLNRSTTGNMSGSEAETIRREEFGNIGVTTTMQMIKEQREVVLLDMYQVITDEFKKQFCVMIY